MRYEIKTILKLEYLYAEGGGLIRVDDAPDEQIRAVFFQRVKKAKQTFTPIFSWEEMHGCH